MEIQDFSNNFDVLLNSYAVAAGFSSTDNPGTIELNEHEKSILLTKAQEDIVLELYTGRNIIGKGFEETEELKRYLAPLVCEVSLLPITNTSGTPIGIDTYSYFFTLPDGKTPSNNPKPEVWFITYESVNISNGKCKSMTSLQVVPTTQDEYHKIKKNPFRGANNRRALRLDLSEGNVEIISKYSVTDYYIRYLTRPKPIVLVNMTSEDGLGEMKAQGCCLHEALHQKILDRAVQLAITTRGKQVINRE